MISCGICVLTDGARLFDVSDSTLSTEGLLEEIDGCKLGFQKMPVDACKLGERGHDCCKS